ncbi:MAG: class I SAM-dependent methyltransferase, partial [Acidimicrobiia bacterium]
VPGWMLDERASAGRENLDAEHVARYDDKEDASAASEVALLQSLGLHASSTVIEFGPGTGQFTVAVAPACGHVIAVDISPVMRARLLGKCGAAGRTNVSVVDAGFLTYQHLGPPADFVYTRYALHHLPDFWKAVAFTRMRSMLRTGGIVRLWDVVYHFDIADAAERLEAWCATGGADVSSEWLRAELDEHVRDEHSTFTWLLEPMMERAGFEIERAEYSADGFSAQYVARAM